VQNALGVFSKLFVIDFLNPYIIVHHIVVGQDHHGEGRALTHTNTHSHTQTQTQTPKHTKKKKNTYAHTQTQTHTITHTFPRKHTHTQTHTHAHTQQAAKIMLKKKAGRIINISSVVGQIGNPGQVCDTPPTIIIYLRLQPSLSIYASIHDYLSSVIYQACVFCLKKAW